MRAGGGHAKGSDFERLTGTKLSLWVSRGHRADLFARNVLSGGQFTNQIKKGSAETGTPGDLMANHPLAFDFLSLFLIECKHYADLGFEAFLFDEIKPRKSFLAKVLDKCIDQAGAANPQVYPLVIARQNRRPTIVVCDGQLGSIMLAGASSRRALPRHHILHSGSIMMLQFDQMLALIDPTVFIADMKAHRNSTT